MKGNTRQFRPAARAPAQPAHRDLRQLISVLARLRLLLGLGGDSDYHEVLKVALRQFYMDHRSIAEDVRLELDSVLLLDRPDCESIDANQKRTDRA
ncbi:MAG: hypothetical protein AAF355_02015 [Myxococcota bacterium]